MLMRVILNLMALLSLTSIGFAQPPLKLGEYPAVTLEELIGEHVCHAVGKSGDSFHLIFNGKNFEINGGGDNPIPEHVVEAILGKKRDVKKITGEWRRGEKSVELTKIQADGKGEFKDTEIKPFKSAPTIVRLNLNTRQYILRKMK